jgi:tRNA modification GTPase
VRMARRLVCSAAAVVTCALMLRLECCWGFRSKATLPLQPQPVQLRAAAQLRPSFLPWTSRTYCRAHDGLRSIRSFQKEAHLRYGQLHSNASSFRSGLKCPAIRLHQTTSSNSQSAAEAPSLYHAEDTNSDSDTIYALASGGIAGQATAVAVIRISGSLCTSILSALSAPSRNAASLPQPRVATLRKLYHPVTREPLDQALVVYFAAPQSFTGEDCLELQCHGSRAVVSAVLDALGQITTSSTNATTSSTAGPRKIRLAEAGEFTQRAFASGKLDLMQVEALADLLTADTARQRTLALSQLDGRTSAVYTAWRAELIAGLAHAEAIIDFGDDERLDDDAFVENEPNSAAAMQQQQEALWGKVGTKMQLLLQSMQQQLLDQRRGEMIRDGVKIAILGPPNAGKSSLFNVLATREAAIVSSIAGTTRDVLEIALNLGGVKCILQDTAGVRSDTGPDMVEQEGIQRAIRAATDADFVIVMVDATNAQSGLDSISEVLTSQAWEAKRLLLVRNKVDLINGEGGTYKWHEPQLTLPLDLFGAHYTVSCTTQEGMNEFLADLTQRVTQRVSFAPSQTSGTESTTLGDGDASDGLLITRARHRQHVRAASEALERFLSLSRQGSMAVDMAAEELRLASSELGRITGAVDVEDVLDKLFSDFCIGK